MKHTGKTAAGAMLLGMLALAWPAFATEVEMARTYGPALEQCFYNAVDDDERAACTGLLDALCRIGEQVGDDPIGISLCLKAELSVWEQLLGAEYSAFSEDLAHDDAAHADDPPEMRARTEALEQAQQAWSGFRDAECQSRVTQLGGDLARGDSILRSRCQVKMTARRTIELHARRSAAGTPEMRP